jgi:DNA polymerase III alpha subunit
MQNLLGRPAQAWCPLKIMLQHSQGLVCLTGAVPFGLLPRLLLDGQQEKAKRTLLALREAFEGGCSWS